MRVPLEIAPGIVSDETNFATPGSWIDGNKVRFYKGLPEPIGGWDELYASALTGKCRNVLSWFDNRGIENIAFGTHSKLYVLVEGVLHDITPTDLVAGNADQADRADVAGWGQGAWGYGPWGAGPLVADYPRTWSLANYGEYLLASPRGKGLYVWQNDTSAVATKVTQAPTSMTAMLVTPERQVLAIGCHEEVSAQFNPRAIRGSDLEDYTDWTTTSSNNAFEHILEGGGNVITASLVGNTVAIWTESSVHQGRYLGLPDQTYQFDIVDKNIGIAAPNAKAVVGDTAYWLAPNLQFYAWNPSAGAPVMLNCPIRTDFADNIDTWEIDKVACTYLTRFGEVWWFYPDTRDTATGAAGECSRFVAFNVNDGIWFRGELARSAARDRPAAYPLFVDPSGTAWSHELGTIVGGWSLRSSGQYFMEGERRVMLLNVWPDFENQSGNVKLEFFVQNYPQATAKQKGPYTLAAGREKKDLRVEGRIVAVQLSGEDSHARLGKLTFDVVGTGQR